MSYVHIANSYVLEYDDYIPGLLSKGFQRICLIYKWPTQNLGNLLGQLVSWLEKHQLRLHALCAWSRWSQWSPAVEETLDLQPGLCSIGKVKDISGWWFQTRPCWRLFFGRQAHQPGPYIDDVGGKGAGVEDRTHQPDLAVAAPATQNPKPPWFLATLSSKTKWWSQISSFIPTTGHTIVEVIIIT